MNQYYNTEQCTDIINNLYFNIENVLNVQENNVHNQCLQAFQEIFKKNIFRWKCCQTSPLQRCKVLMCGSSNTDVFQ